jgi:hypothetical protein
MVGYIIDLTQEREDMNRLRPIERRAISCEASADARHAMNQPVAPSVAAAAGGPRFLNTAAGSAAIAIVPLAVAKVAA